MSAIQYEAFFRNSGPKNQPLFNYSLAFRAFGFDEIVANLYFDQVLHYFNSRKRQTISDLPHPDVLWFLWNPFYHGGGHRTRRIFNFWKLWLQKKQQWFSEIKDTAHHHVLQAPKAFYRNKRDSTGASGSSRGRALIEKKMSEKNHHNWWHHHPYAV